MEHIKRPILSRWGIFFLAILLIISFISVYMATLPKWTGKLDTMLLCENNFCPGTKGTIRIIVLNHDGLKPVKDADINVWLSAKNRTCELLHKKSDMYGTMDGTFYIPSDMEEGEGTLTVKILSPVGQDDITQKINIYRSCRILLTTDKPVYQPGQTVHIRSLSMENENFSPVTNRSATIEVEDSKGNKVFKRTDKKTSPYGIASADFILAREAEPGDYKIRSIVGGNQSEITVSVKKYVLPKFKVTLSTDKKFYRPGEIIKGDLKADYFFGKPVSGGTVRVELASYDVEYHKFAEIQGKTDEYGNFTFEQSLEKYLVGQPLEGGKGIVRFTVDVTDKAEHKEINYETLFVSKDTVQITILPESGEIVPGIENILYLITSYPDGAPCRATVSMKLGQQSVRRFQTSSTGIAEFTLKPDFIGRQIEVNASDGLGNSGNLTFVPQTGQTVESILLRTDKAVYKDSDVMKLEILSFTEGSVFLDIVKNRQTRLTKILTVEDKQATLDIPLTDTLTGTLQINAYRLKKDGNFTKDTKTVYVEISRDLSVKVSSDKDIYRPGRTGKIDFEVKDKEGKPVPAALGISVVDESVFALAEKEPGLEKVYFTLEQDLLKPKVEVCKHYIDMVSDDLIRKKNDQNTAKVAFCSIPEEPYSIMIHTYPERLARIMAMQQKYFYFLQWSGMLCVMLILILSPTAILVLTFYNEILKKKDEERFLPVTSDNFVTMIVYTGGFFLVFLTPFVMGFLTYIILNMEHHYHRNEYTSLICSMTAMALAALIYTIKLRNKSRSEDIKKLNTLRYSFQLIQLFVAGLIVTAALLLACAMTGKEQIGGISISLLFLTGFISSVFMNFILIYNMRSHAGKQRKAIVWHFVYNCGCVVIAGLGLAGLLFAVIAPNFLKARAQGPTLSGTIKGDTSTLSVASDEVAPKYASGQGLAVDGGGFSDKKEIVQKELSGAKTSRTETSHELPPYLRQYFPETMYFNAELITDEQGKASTVIKMADSITTWRMGVSASSMKGDTGGTDYPIKVFQDFFIDLDLPLNLTSGDEVSIPVSVYNYLPEKQDIELIAVKDDWFDLLCEPVKRLSLGPNDVTVVYYPVKIHDTGKKRFTVYAKTAKMKDGISKSVTIIPDGKEKRFAENGWLRESVSAGLNIPEHAINKSYDMWIKIYPGMFSQLVEGLDSMLKMPYGCFEQTTSVTYPNIMVLDYMKTSGQITPDIQMKAEHYINLGYQRLITFEVPSGGFSLYGEAPASVWLSAYGLIEMYDMNRVYPVDEKIIERTKKWLISRQEVDGSWKSDGYSSWDAAGGGDSDLRVTAFVAWSLAQSGYEGEALKKAISYIKSSMKDQKDFYTMSLVANLLLYTDPKGQAAKDILETLYKGRSENKDGVSWAIDGRTLTQSYGMIASIETTSLVTQAFLRSGSYGDAVEKSLKFLAVSRDTYGTWHSTQATVLALKTLILSMNTDMGKNSKGRIHVLVDGQEAGTVEIIPEQSDVVKFLDLKGYAREGNFNVELVPEGDIRCMYQIIYSYYIPWSSYQTSRGEQSPVKISIAYDRSELRRNDILQARVAVTNTSGKPGEAVIIDLGVPPGFDVIAEDFENLVKVQKIERFDMTGRKVIVYLKRLEPGKSFGFSYGMRAKFPVKITTPVSEVYEYYNANTKGYSVPEKIEVTL
ncbi:MAG: MG2 domain-containing protein [Candidatus Eremiobacterota bacterium]